MKAYPSIRKLISENIPDNSFHIFAKYDGSNIRAEWSPKQGFYKFGSRHQLIDQYSPFKIAIELVKDKFEKDLSDIFKAQKYQSAICFFELWGEDSFAGSHNFEKPFNLTLFDVAPYKKGILIAEQFIEIFGHLDIAKVLHVGQITPEVYYAIKGSTLPDMPLEGVVAKSVDKKLPLMYKIKSDAWLARLKKHCGDDLSLYAMLE